jgi:phosphoribosyl 1,2-cyclic phosphodiesterase
VRCEGLPPLVLDCGTGGRLLGNKLIKEPAREVHILFSHLHVDHVFGLPFFVPIYAPGWDVHVSVPSYSADEARERIGRYLNGTFHPTRLRDVPANLVFQAVRAGRPVDAGGWDVMPVRLNHPGGAMGYRVRASSFSFAYITDTAPFAKPGEGVTVGDAPTSAEQRVIAALAGCHTVAYDAMYDLDEYLQKMTWGHSYPEYAIALCKAAGVKRLVLFHHLPDASDDDLDARAARYAVTDGLDVIVAREGETLDIDADVASET